MHKPIYTRSGDSGQTSLGAGRRVPKTSPVMESCGDLEELITRIGLSSVSLGDGERSDSLRAELDAISRIVAAILFSLRGTENGKGDGALPSDNDLTALEQQIDGCGAELEEADPVPQCRHSAAAAALADAGSVARRAERSYIRADLAIGSRASQRVRRYLNRLSDYLYTAAAFEEQKARAGEGGNGNTVRVSTALSRPSAMRKEQNRMNPMSLNNLKHFMQALEDEAARRGLALVIAVCDSGARPVAVHVMDDAFIASYDIAVNKAYTAVSLKMSTKELVQLCQPGGSLYGLQQTNDSRIVIFGGGVLLKDREGTILGGLGVSGSTAEIDTMMGDVGEELFLRLQNE